MDKAIAFFDFDGTLTTRDSFTAFIIYAVSWPALILKGLLFSPVVILFYLGLVSNSLAKGLSVRLFFKGWSVKKLEEMGRRFYGERLVHLLRPGVLERLRWHQQKGHHTVLVSASLRFWLEDFCQQNGLSLICTELEEIGDKITGRLNPRNCFGPEKVRKIKECYELGAYTMVYAYGDTRGDREMLEIADHAYFKPFRGKDHFGVEE